MHLGDERRQLNRLGVFDRRLLFDVEAGASVERVIEEFYAALNAFGLDGALDERARRYRL